MQYSENSTRIRHYLIFFSGAEQLIYDLDRFPQEIITFGRDPENDMVISSPLVSREHGYLLRDGENYVMVNDPKSANGLLFREQLTDQMELRDGDCLRIDRIIKESGAQVPHPSERDPEGVLLLYAQGPEEETWQRVPTEGRNLLKIGRDPSCEIRLSQAGVSRFHGNLERREGGWFISDNQSTNGILLNGALLQGSARLREKDVLSVGGSRLVFTRDAVFFQGRRRGISVEARSVTRRVNKGRLTICDHTSLFIRGGELVAFIGGSGAGKSTLMNCLCGYTKPEEGTVYLGGEDLYRNLSYFRRMIGYVPQADIVFDNLTVAEMLRYAARLRLPPDTAGREREARIQEVLDMTELTGKEDTPIKRLSGGQKKRVSIAVELIPDPDLLFLDEPTSGLDPETERSLMGTLKRMSRSGKTIILVTHSTLQLKMCDKIAFMGRGGRLCYFGPWQEALDFFGVEDIVDAYRMMGEDAPALKERFDSTRVQRGPGSAEREEAGTAKQRRKGGLRQWGILMSRNLTLLFKDKSRLLLLLLQAPLLAVLIWLVSDGEQFKQYDMTFSILFALACSAFWVGILNAIQEVCKERTILKREYMTGEKLGSYLLAKFGVLTLMSLIQALLMIGVFALLVGYPDEGVWLHPVIEMLITAWLTILASAAMGLFVSCLFKNADRAMALAPLLLMPQILFSGVLFKLQGAFEKVSWFVTCRWTMKGYGATANLNALPTALMQQGVPVERLTDDFYAFTKENLLESWWILLVFVAGFLLLGRIALRNVRKGE